MTPRKPAPPLEAEIQGETKGTLMKLCECGCGVVAPIIQRTDFAKGYVAGEQRKFVAGHNSRVNHPMYRGGINVSHGYRRKRVAVHYYRAEHVLIAEAAIGHPLPPKAVVHHFDLNRANNATSNLVVCEDHAYHMLLHRRQRILDAGGDPNTERLCWRCKKTFPFSNFYESQCYPHGLSKACRSCAKELNASRYQ